MNTPKLTDEQRQAIQSQPGEFLRVEDDQTHKVYLIIEESRAAQLYEQLQVGFDEAERGDVAEWDLAEFLAKMHRQHARFPSYLGKRR